MNDVLTKEFAFIKFPKPTPKKPKTMLDYAKKRAKKLTTSKVHKKVLIKRNKRT